MARKITVKELKAIIKESLKEAIDEKKHEVEMNLEITDLDRAVDVIADKVMKGELSKEELKTELRKMIDKAIERERNALIEEIRKAKEEIVERLGEESDRVYERVGDAAANTMEALSGWLKLVRKVQDISLERNAQGFEETIKGINISLRNQAELLRDVKAALLKVEELEKKMDKTKEQVEMARLDFDLWRNS